MFRTPFAIVLVLGLSGIARGEAANNALLNAEVYSDSQFSVQLFANSSSGSVSSPADVPAIISWVAQGTVGCTLFENGNALVQSAVGSLPRMFDGVNPVSVYAISCQSALGRVLSATVQVAWELYGVGGPNHGSYAFRSHDEAEQCRRAIASASDKNCAKMVRISLVSAASVGSFSSGGASCSCGSSGGGGGSSGFSWNDAAGT